MGPYVLFFFNNVSGPSVHLNFSISHQKRHICTFLQIQKKVFIIPIKSCMVKKYFRKTLRKIFLKTFFLWRIKKIWDELFYLGSSLITGCVVLI